MAMLTDSLMLDSILLSSIVLLLFYFKTIFLTYKYWKHRNIPYLEPSFPFGNMGDGLMFRRPMHLVYQDIYMKIKHEMKLPYCGTFTMGVPVLILTDPQLIKNVMIKDFDVFTDHGIFEADDKSSEPILKNLFGLTGEEWRKLRNKMSPTFTSGRIREMFPLIDACGRNLVTVLSKNLTKAGPGTSIDVKEYLVRYMTDVIGSSVFGIEINAIENPDTEFLKVSRKITQPNLRDKVVMLIFNMFPNVKKFLTKLNVSMMDKKATEFFTNVVRQNVKYREENNVRRNDFINIMMQLQKLDPDITEEVITAQCFVFFIAGFDTSSSVLTHGLYELANNQDIQTKLRQEIRDTKRKHGGELSYECYQEMTLLDKVMKESLRLYAPLAQLDRISSRSYQIPDTDVVLDARTKVLVPLYGIHHDPDIFPEPDKFDPERFAPENADNIPHYAYMPFGEGPRNCIGKRFGQLQLKSGLALLISNFEWHPDPTNDIRYTKGEIGLRLVKPLKLKPRPLSD